MVVSHKHIVTLVFLALLAVTSWIKVSFLVGSHTGFFSLSHCLIPLFGLVGGLGGVISLFLTKTALHVYAAHTSTALLFALHLPTLCAGLYCHYMLRTQSSIARWLLLAIPVLCMILFGLHPIGNQAFAYSLFWLIPIMSLTLPHNKPFLHMLGSTFTAHAVGSVMWLYAGLLPNPSLWLTLIPLVIVERLMMATGMMLVYYCIRGIKQHTAGIKHISSSSVTI